MWLWFYLVDSSPIRSGNSESTPFYYKQLSLLLLIFGSIGCAEMNLHDPFLFDIKQSFPINAIMLIRCRFFTLSIVPHLKVYNL